MMVKNGLLERGRDILSNLAGIKIKNHLVRLDLMKAKKAIMAATDDYLEVKNDLIMQFGEETPEGFQIGPDTPGLDEFTKKINELLNAETDFSPTLLPDRALEFLDDLSVLDLEVLEACGVVKFEEESPIALVEDTEDGGAETTG